MHLDCSKLEMNVEHCSNVFASQFDTTKITWIEFVSKCECEFACVHPPQHIPYTIFQEEFAQERADIEREHLARVEAHELEKEEMHREHLAKIESHEVMIHIYTYLPSGTLT